MKTYQALTPRLPPPWSAHVWRPWTSRLLRRARRPTGQRCGSAGSAPDARWAVADHRSSSTSGSPCSSPVPTGSDWTSISACTASRATECLRSLHPDPSHRAARRRLRRSQLEPACAVPHPGLRRSLDIQLSDGSWRRGIAAPARPGSWVLQIALFTLSERLGPGECCGTGGVSGAAWRAFRLVVAGDGTGRAVLPGAELLARRSGWGTSDTPPTATTRRSPSASWPPPSEPGSARMRPSAGDLDVRPRRGSPRASRPSGAWLTAGGSPWRCRPKPTNLRRDRAGRPHLRGGPAPALRQRGAARQRRRLDRARTGGEGLIRIGTDPDDRLPAPPLHASRPEPVRLG